MPLRRGRGKAVPGSDPLTACLDANGTYICTAFNPRCYIIQKIAEILPYVKVTAANTPGPSLDPNADEFETKNNVDVEGWEPLPNLVYPPTDGYVYMNGDVGKLPSGAVFNNSTPDTTSNNSNTISSNVQGSEYVAVNGVTEGAEGLSPIPPSAPQENASQSSAYPLPQLKQMLSQQLEYYFSRENLANDTYLLSQMDNDQYVPIWTVANFNQVKRLTKDIKLITEVLRESPNVQVDEEGVKVRPNHKRCIVILREIPDSTPIDDVKNLFAGENCPRFISCEFAHNSSWYVTFESDEDAQRAYRYLREEVREFQGKPIMARIKAKPMNRLPIPPVTAVKNDFRATPPPTAVYDPGAFPPGQQRFIYTNGTPGQPVAYTNQVHVYSPYQQQFYASVMQWPTGGAYFDISSVFQVNGLAPQPFKPAPYRSNTRPRKQSRSNVQSDQASQGSASSSGGGGGSTGGGSGGNGPVNVRQNSQVLPSIPTQNNFKGDHDAHSTSNSSIGKLTIGQYFPHLTEANHNHIEGLPMINSDGTLEMYRLMPTPQMHISREVLPPRHRRKKRDDDNSATNTNAQSQSKEFINSRGAHFDLEDSAFPPLPGLDAGNQSIKQSSNLGNSSNAETLQTQSAVEQQTQGHWGENRLADVVKGTVKSKSSSKESSSGGENDSPRANSPQHYSHSSQTNTSIGVASSTTLTSVATVTTASTMTVNVKTTNISEHSCGKEITVSENADVQSNSCSNSNNSTLTPPNSPPETLVPVMTTKCTMADKSTKTDDALLNGDLDLPCPTTTNAATMTTIVPTEAPSRLSQVAASTSSKNCNSVHRQESKSSDTLNTKSAPSPPPNYDHSYNPPRMSYAQVAQHHKEITAQREKQLNNSNKEKQTIETSTSPGKNASSVANSNSSNSSSSRVQNDCRGEPKENGQQQQQSSQQQPQQQQQKENTNTNRNEQRHNPGSSNRNGTRSSHERSQRRRPESRTTQLRDYVTPRSPK